MNKWWFGSASNPFTLPSPVHRQGLPGQAGIQHRKWWFGLASNLFTLALTLATLLLGYMPWLWDTSGTLLAHVPQLPQGTIARSIVCFLIDGFLRTIIGLPWSAYSAFVVEQRHGFNKQTVGTFITDVLKKVGRLML